MLTADDLTNGGLSTFTDREVKLIEYSLLTGIQVPKLDIGKQLDKQGHVAGPYPTKPPETARCMVRSVRSLQPEQFKRTFTQYYTSGFTHFLKRMQGGRIIR
jgi:hypothetical protein